MFQQHYECVGVFDGDRLIGLTGLWYQTRHYSGQSCEVDHVYIDQNYRSGGIGKQFFEFIEAHVKAKGCEAIELNTYVQNTASHKFYYNLGFKILGFHFFEGNLKVVYICNNAGVAQLVERQPSKLNVAGSNPVSRSTFQTFL